MKLRKFPKKPTAKASLSTWKNYEKKCIEVIKHNKTVMQLRKGKGGGAGVMVSIPPKNTPPTLSNAKNLK